MNKFEQDECDKTKIHFKQDYGIYPYKSSIKQTIHGTFTSGEIWIDPKHIIANIKIPEYYRGFKVIIK